MLQHFKSVFLLAVSQKLQSAREDTLEIQSSDKGPLSKKPLYYNINTRFWPTVIHTSVHNNLEKTEGELYEAAPCVIDIAHCD